MQVYLLRYKTPASDSTNDLEQPLVDGKEEHWFRFNLEETVKSDGDEGATAASDENTGTFNWVVKSHESVPLDQVPVYEGTVSQDQVYKEGFKQKGVSLCCGRIPVLLLGASTEVEDAVARYIGDKPEFAIEKTAPAAAATT